MSQKRTVYRGMVCEPYRVVKAEENKGLAVWFYANRGKFEFLIQDSEKGVWRKPIQFQVSTRTLRAALKLVSK